MEAVAALALVGGHVEEEFLVRNEYLAAENNSFSLSLDHLHSPKKFNKVQKWSSSLLV